MKNKKEIIVKIDGKEWKDAIDKAFDKKIKTVKVDGFREGKCPRDIYEQKFGKESLYMDAVEYVIDKAYQKALDDSKLVPVVQPTVDLSKVDNDAAEFKFNIIVKPEIKIKKYKKLKVKREEVKVSKEEVNTEIELLRKKYAEIVVKDGKIELGDTAVIDFEGFKDEKAFEGGKGENYPLEIGSKTFIPGFEEQLVGHKLGEDLEVTVKFPEDYPSEDLKGKDVVFKVKIHEVKTKKIPELKKDFFLDLSIDGVKDIESLEKHVETEILNRKNNEEDNKFISNVLEEISKETVIDLNDEIVEAELNQMLDQYREKLKMQGITLEQYLEFTKSTIDDMKNNLKDEAKKNVLYRYIIEEIKRIEDISVTDKEIEEEANKLAELYKTTVEELKKAFGTLDVIKYDLEMKKTLEFLKDNN
ncbi:MAG: trigger factor [Bacilli bacterium]|nr:trigger factor [Bacilli bacterium]